MTSMPVSSTEDKKSQRKSSVQDDEETEVSTQREESDDLESAHKIVDFSASIETVHQLNIEPQNLVSNGAHDESLIEKFNSAVDCELVDGKVATKTTAFLCSHCKKEFKRRVEYLYHLCRDIHAKCHLCNQMMSRSSIRTHMRLKHSAEFKADLAKTTCRICNSVHFSSRTFKNHNVSRHNIMQKCDLCSFRSKSLKTLSRHRRASDGNSVYQCSQCAYVSCVKPHLVRHEQLAHRKPLQTNKKLKRFYCSSCEKSLKSGRELTAHMILVHHLVPSVPNRKRPHLCSHCHRTFILEHTLASHIRRYHCSTQCQSETGEKVVNRQADTVNVHSEKKRNLPARSNRSKSGFVCRYCGICFVGVVPRWRHIKRFHPDKLPNSSREVSVKIEPDDNSAGDIKMKKKRGGRPLSGKTFKCTYCRSEFNSHKALSLHHQEVHRPVLADTYECRYCGLRCDHKFQRTEHERRVHTGFPCKRCGVVVKTQLALDCHKSSGRCKFTAALDVSLVKCEKKNGLQKPMQLLDPSIFYGNIGDDALVKYCRALVSNKPLPVPNFHTPNRSKVNVKAVYPPKQAQLAAKSRKEMGCESAITCVKLEELPFTEVDKPCVTAPKTQMKLLNSLPLDRAILGGTFILS